MQALEASANAEVGVREKARLRELQRLKKQKIQEILDAQNAAVDADMVCEYCGLTYCRNSNCLCLIHVISSLYVIVLYILNVLWSYFHVNLFQCFT